MNQCKCGSMAINDDPARTLCDTCWRDKTIVTLHARVSELEARASAMCSACAAHDDRLTPAEREVIDAAVTLVASWNKSWMKSNEMQRTQAAVAALEKERAATKGKVGR